MKNITQTIYITIFILLFVTCIFNIAELNIIAKTDYTNHLEQSIVMNASYLLLCKLIIQSVITYVIGNILYHRIKDKVIEKDLQRSMDNVSTDTTSQQHYDSLVKTLDQVYGEPDINTLQFDPIDQVDKYDKFGIDYVENTMEIKRDSKGYIKSVEKKKPIDFGYINGEPTILYEDEIHDDNLSGIVQPEGRLLSDILNEYDINNTSFTKGELSRNERYIEVEYATADMIKVGEEKYKYFKRVK